MWELLLTLHFPLYLATYCSTFDTSRVRNKCKSVSPLVLQIAKVATICELFSFLFVYPPAYWYQCDRKYKGRLDGDKNIEICLVFLIRLVKVMV